MNWGFFGKRNVTNIQIISDENVDNISRKLLVQYRNLHGMKLHFPSCASIKRIRRM